MNDIQLKLLRRIADGTTPISSSDSNLAVSVYVLRSRKLVTLKGQRCYWTASITDLGRSVLEHGSLAEAIAARATARPPAAAIVKPQRSARTPTPAVVGLAGRNSRVDSVVPIVEKLVRPHPIIAATRGEAKRSSDGWVDTMRMPGMLHVRVAPTSLRRVLLVAQSVILEAQRRGHRIEQGAHDRRCAGGLCIVVDGHRFELTFVEETDRRSHVATKAELERAARRSWERIPDWDRFPSGRVQLRCGHDANRPLATDRVRWRLEDRLDRALTEIERRAAALAQRAIEQQRRVEQQRLEWEDAMRVARARLIESQRSEVLKQQTEQWRHASEIRNFIQAVRARDGAPWAADPKTEAWLTWAAEHADSIDPLLGSLSVPEALEPSPSALEPFLNGWSAYGPDRRGIAY